MKAVRIVRRDLDRNLPPEFIQRGQAYARQGRVSDLVGHPDQGRFVARVKGSEKLPYAVEIQVLAGSGGARIQGRCTCPVGMNCKHVAAVLFAVLGDAGDVDDVAPAGWGLATALARPEVRRVVAAPLPGKWEMWLDEATEALEPEPEFESPVSGQRLFYLFDLTSGVQRPGLRVRLVSARPRKAGGFTAPVPWHRARTAIVDPPRFVQPEDVRLLRRLMIDANMPFESEFVLRGEAGAVLLPDLLATGRCHFGDIDSPALVPGEVRQGNPRWQAEPNGDQRLVWAAEPPFTHLLPLAPPWYVDVERSACGPLGTGLPARVAGLLGTMPKVDSDHVGTVRAAIENRLPDIELPLPGVPHEEDMSDLAPVPCLRLVSLEPNRRGYRVTAEPLNLAVLRFDYRGTRVGPADPGLVRQFDGGVLRRIRRDGTAEKTLRAELLREGLAPARDTVPGLPEEYEHEYVFARPEDWIRFVCDRVPVLRDAGWIVEYDDGFDYRPVEAGEWHAEIVDTGNDWFDVSLGVDVEGRRIDLLPVVMSVLKTRPDLTAEGADGMVAVRLPDGRILPVPVERVRPVVAILDELLESSSGPKIRMRRLDAARIGALERTGVLQWHGGEAVRGFADRLMAFEGIAPVAAPEGFLATLRPYQEAGLAWLQFLREYEVGGILADDMGLGKTIQALAHILTEKRAGRLDRPALIVAPTSVVPNWRAEAAKFAPDLVVHVSHGLKRRESLDRIGEADLVITTYPLLSRDREVLGEQEFHLLILDEAQQIKNAHTQAANVVRTMKARHRLCLTGTPLENHLGELWSLFHFLMPGFLGDGASFRRTYRTPIEKHADEGRRASLERRVRPFLLRRTKEQVAADLPPKTEIVRFVELHGDQRELYETVRATVDDRVRREISARGLAQSQIVVLDALLKLRQVCCDPRLVKLDVARKIEGSAKLELLFEMLDELLAEGRRVLLFSQFTEMLGLIEQELAERGIAYVKLTGDTQDRERPVREFQEGRVPLFLISLKAGGTGLNLTAADTVIHYDPWWNPAVERQATDRAHRIGQDRPVFVYKLIVTGSVEEKIAALQAQKAALAEAILGEPGKVTAPLGPDDIAALFEPLE